MSSLSKQARELLACQLEQDGFHLEAELVRKPIDGALHYSALRAIEAALTRTPSEPVAQGEAGPIPMLLFCPQCGLKHIDEPDERTPDWDNPPHRSHLCHGCGCIWRPADVATVGVASLKTRGKADTIELADLSRAPSAQGEVARLRELMAKATERPWQVVEYGDGDSLVIHDARGDWRVCFMATPAKDGDFEGIEANARLIVEAVNALPRLLAVLSTIPTTSTEGGERI